MEYISLYNGVKVPATGYGIYQIKPEECKDCVLNALKAGYRVFDTAQSYGNEAALGQALKESGVSRKELFIITKVRPHFYDDRTRESILESIKNLQTDYIDLVLLHQPFGDVYKAYRELEILYEEGKLKSIGLSNFYADRMVDISYFSKIKPMVNQVEIHPLHQRKDIVEWANKLDIVLFAWSPLGHGRGMLHENPVLLSIAEKYKKTVAQVILRWNFQRGIVTIPKTTKFLRMKENIDIFNFELSDKDINEIEKLETGESVFYSHQDPALIEKYALGVLKFKKENL